jgi:hypothetical protein
MATLHKIDVVSAPVVTINDIRLAATRVQPSIVRTPTLLSRTLSELTGATVYLKFENLQFSISCFTWMKGSARGASSPRRPEITHRVSPIMVGASASRSLS